LKRESDDEDSRDRGLWRPVLRWAIAAALFFGMFHVLKRTTEGGDDYLRVFVQCLFGLASAVAGSVLVAPELAAWAVIPISSAFDAIFLGRRDFDPPPAAYTLARFYREQERYEEALEEYRKIIRYHPEEIAAYLEAIEIAQANALPKVARRLYRTGLRKIRVAADREQLHSAYQSALAAPSPTLL
jgi:tetratricopeptide (TPR) repeat protein